MKVAGETRVKLDRTTARAVGWVIIAMMPISIWANNDPEPLADPAHAATLGVGLGLLLVGYIPTGVSWRRLRDYPLPAFITSVVVLSAVAHLVGVLM